MTERFEIAGYCRISVDEELDRDNVSIENQKAIIRDFVSQRFPDSALTFYEDRDRSGYTFEQREGYQAMRKGLMGRRYGILVVKDFSRFSRRNSRGLVELEDLRDAGVRIISIGDNIDFPNDDDWLKIQFQFLINEMPVTDTSKKVKSVIQRRQADGRWICAAPYGYLVNKRQEFEVIPTEAEVVREIFRLYIDGWGYKKIANHLTDQGIPTPRMAERERKEAAGEEYRRAAKPVWAIVTVQGILDNDFYIGTLRQGKYTRARINGKDVRRDQGEHVVIEHHHQAIIDYRTFATVRALRESRSTGHYRGRKKHDNAYSGFLTCGDCGAPMFAMSRSGLRPAYTCGTYHRRGLKGCTSHHIRVDRLDELMKLYVRKVKDHSSDMLERLNADLAREREDVDEAGQSAVHLEEVLALCSVDRRLVPCIDFGHLNARTLGGIRSQADYAAILDRMGEALGDDRARTFHVHFSRIEFSAGGEKRHWTFADTQYGPEPDPLMELLAERRLAPVVICESAGTQAEDARTLGQIYRRALQKGV